MTKWRARGCFDWEWYYGDAIPATTDSDFYIYDGKSRHLVDFYTLELERGDGDD